MKETPIRLILRSVFTQLDTNAPCYAFAYTLSPKDNNYMIPL